MKLAAVFTVLALTAQKGLAAEELDFQKVLAAINQSALSVKEADLAVKIVRFTKEIVALDDAATISSSLAYKRILLDETEAESRKNLTADLNWRYRLYDFGRQAAAEKIAAMDEKIELVRREEAVEKLNWLAGKLYAAAVLAAKQQEISARQLKLFEFKEQEIGRQYRQGSKSELDVIAAQVESGKAGINLQKARDKQQSALTRICQMMYIGQEELCREKKDLVLPEHLLLLTSPEKILAITKNWQFQTTKATQRRDHQREKLEQSRLQVDTELWPVLSVGLDYQHIAGTKDTTKGSNQTFASLIFDWDIPWAGRWRFEKSRIAEQQLRVNLEEQNELSQRRMQEQNLSADFAALVNQWDMMLQQRKLLEQKRDLVRQKYANGRATLLELNEAESDLVSLEQDIVTLSGQSFSLAVDLAETRGVAAVASLFEEVS